VKQLILFCLYHIILYSHPVLSAAQTKVDKNTAIISTAQNLSCSDTQKKLGLIFYPDKQKLSAPLQGCQIKQVIPLSLAWYSKLKAMDRVIAVDKTNLRQSVNACKILKQEITLAIKHSKAMQWNIISDSKHHSISIATKPTNAIMQQQAYTSYSVRNNNNNKKKDDLSHREHSLYTEHINDHVKQPDLSCLANQSSHPVLPLIKQLQKNPNGLYYQIELLKQALISSNSSLTNNYDFSLGRLNNSLQSISYTTNKDNVNIHIVMDTPELFLDSLKNYLSLAHKQSKQAFEKISHQNRHFFLNHYPQLSSSIERYQHLLNSDNMHHLDILSRLFEIAAKVDMQKLSQAATYWFQLSQINWPHLLHSKYDTLFAQQIQSIHTEYGMIVLGTMADDTYHINNQHALIIDPGGNDQYIMSTDTHSALTKKYLNHAIIDISGNDRYLSSNNKGLSAAILAISLLYDLKGNDNYQGYNWSQASSFAGAAALYDKQGNDHYHATAFSQASALFGSAILWDLQGDDRYTLNHHGQGLGLPYGHGLLLDNLGQDHYTSQKGLPSTYSSAQILTKQIPSRTSQSKLSTESWSQGCGKGFRHILPGGVGLLFDLQGQDKLTADEFAQGCGYYFALGLLYNLNTQADHYQGSRYTLGASAHQATAAFIDTGGNDHYATTGAAFCGAAWDQSSALFYDQSGNDIYDSKDFSLGRQLTIQ